MSQSSCSPSEPSQEGSGIHTVYERRYRTSKYFLEDQLRCSEAVQDFRTVKSVLSNTSLFTVRQAFRFASEPVPALANVPVEGQRPR
jgi:hypothetical protein